MSLLATPAQMTSTLDKTDDIEENSETQQNTELLDDELSDSGHDTDDETKRLEVQNNFPMQSPK